MPATTFAELFGAVFPTAAQVESGVVYGPTGADFTGTLGDGITIGSRFTPTFNSPNEVYPTAAQVELGVVYGPDGTNFTGTLTGSATLPTTAEQAVGRTITYDEQGDPESGVSVTVKVYDFPDAKGVVADDKVWTVVSDANGLVQFDALFKGWTYKIWRGSIKDQRTFVVPSTTAEGLDENDNFLIDAVIGQD